MGVMSNASLDGLFLPSIPSIPFVSSILPYNSVRSTPYFLPHHAQPDAKAHGEVVDVFAEVVTGLEAVVVARLRGFAR